MVAQAMMFKVEGTAQAAQLSGLAGKSYTVGKVSSGGTGMSKWLFLNPSAAGAGAKSGSVAIKLANAQQAAQAAGLAGKTVTVGASPVVVGGASKWLVLAPGKGATAAAALGAAGAKTAAATKGGSSMIMMKLEGGRQMTQLSTIAGKNYTVVKAPMMGAKAKSWLFLKPAGGAAAAGAASGKSSLIALNVQTGNNLSLASLTGKTFTISKAPIAAGKAAASKWMLLTPVGSGAAATGAGAAAAVTAKAGSAKAATVAMANGNATMQTVAMQTAATGGGATTAAAGTAATGTAVATTGAASSGGTIWSGKGLSLGLGLGLGAWGPVILLGAAAVGVGVYNYRKRSKNSDAGELEDLVS